MCAVVERECGCGVAGHVNSHGRDFVGVAKDTDLTLGDRGW